MLKINNDYQQRGRIRERLFDFDFRDQSLHCSGRILKVHVVNSGFQMLKINNDYPTTKKKGRGSSILIFVISHCTANVRIKNCFHFLSAPELSS